MRSVLLISALAVALPLLAQPRPASRVLRDVLPASTDPALFTLTSDEQRTYHLTPAGEVWVYSRGGSPARVTAGNPWDLSLAPTRDALVYTRAGDVQGERYVWLIPLDPRTGQPTGSERRLSTSQGDVPSISPDGRWVAFARNDSSGVGQSIVVVPIAGGGERVVAPSLPSNVDHIRWTPDGKTLFFGVNPPVPCVPDWSCLAVPRAEKYPTGSIRRASVEGGDVRIIAVGRSPAPGLSPDGTMLVYVDTGATRRIVVADSGGRRISDLPFPATQVISGWLSGATLLVREAGNIQRVVSVSIADGQSRQLFEGTDRVVDPVWSPDGKVFSVIGRSGDKSEIRIFNADGSRRAVLPLADNFANASSWSPDGKTIAYSGTPGDGTSRVKAVDVATGRITELFDAAKSSSATMIWLPDSRGVIVSDISRSQGADRRVAFRQIDLTGKSALLRDVILGDVPAAGVAIDATTALVMRGAQHDYRVIPLRGDSVERPIVSGLTGIYSMLTFSADRHWIAFKRSATPADPFNTIEVLRVDGSARTTVQLSFSAARGPANFVILPGGKTLIVAEALRQDTDPGVYLVDVATGSAKKLFTYSSRGARSGMPEVALSRDGRTLLSTGWEALTPTISAMDLSPLRNSSRR